MKIVLYIMMILNLILFCINGNLFLHGNNTSGVICLMNLGAAAWGVYLLRRV